MCQMGRCLVMLRRIGWLNDVLGPLGAESSPAGSQVQLGLRTRMWGEGIAKDTEC